MTQPVHRPSLLEGIASSINTVAHQLSSAAESANYSAQSTALNSQQDTLKQQWGRTAFDAYMAGDHDKVKELADHCQSQIDALQSKASDLEQKRTRMRASSNMVSITVPHDATPGSTFLAKLPHGDVVEIKVGPENKPGSQIMVDRSQLPATAPVTAAAEIASAEPVQEGQAGEEVKQST